MEEEARSLARYLVDEEETRCLARYLVDGKRKTIC